MARVYLALMHYPVLNKEGQTVTTSVTCFDLHDIARTALTYGLKGYFVVNPLPSQQKLSRRILGYWKEGPTADWNPTRRDAFQVVRVTADYEETIGAIRQETGKTPRTVITTARPHPERVSFKSLRENLKQEEENPWLLIFGTGWGLSEQFKKQADMVLEPVQGTGEYNHLPVRAAVAIILDRLLSADHAENER